MLSFTYWKRYCTGLTFAIASVTFLNKCLTVPTLTIYDLFCLTISGVAIGVAVRFYIKDQIELQKLRQDNADLIHDNVRLMSAATDECNP